MKIKTFKVDNYYNCPVYYRNFDNIFEYLVIIKKELYTTHLQVSPSRKNLLRYYLGLADSKYSEKDLKNIIKQLRLMAEASIETVLKIKKKTSK
jgi:hypothetical protein